MDCQSWYDQFLLHPASRDLTAIATPLGLMRMVTLPMGWTNSVAIAQRESLKREVPAAVRGLTMLHQYIWGVEFILETDSATLVGAVAKLDTLDSAVKRWLLTIRSYQPLSIVHIEGRKNVVSDVLSCWNLGDDEDDSVGMEDCVDEVLVRSAVDKMGEEFLMLVTTFDVFMMQETRMGRKFGFDEVRGFDFSATHFSYTVDFPAECNDSGVFGEVVIVVLYFPSAYTRDSSKRPLKDSQVPYKMQFTQAVLEKLRDYERCGLKVIAGCDWNIAATVADIHQNLLLKVNSGFWLKERQLLGQFYLGFQDCYQVIHPNKVSYTTWWSATCVGDLGFRFDGVLVSKHVKVIDADHVEWPRGSDHTLVVAVLEVGGRVVVEEMKFSLEADGRAWLEWTVGGRLLVFAAGSLPNDVGGEMGLAIVRQAALFSVEDGSLFPKPRRNCGGVLQRVIGLKSEPERIVAEMHEGVGGGHGGVPATVAKILERYWWLGIWGKVGVHCWYCDTCEQQNLVRYHEELEVQDGRLFARLFGRWHIDLCLMEGTVKHVALFIEEISGWIEGGVFKRKKAEPIVALFVKEVCLWYGVPKEVVIDGGELDARVFCDTSDRFGFIVAAIAKSCEGKPKGWYHHFAAAVFAWRITVSRTPGFRPSELWKRMSTEELLVNCIRMLERQEVDLAEAQRLIEQARMKQAEAFGKDHCMRLESEFVEEGDLVVLRDSKLDTMVGGKLRLRYFGPFWVVEKGLNLLEAHETHVESSMFGNKV
ncbi:hypothetical protein BDR26DRAFT_986700 [Obelidium mucronatum]|nr:hypothetical protein BDR26DRAFT_986700 [Obelidium mucronatum]